MRNAEKPFSIEEFKVKTEQYFELQRKFFEYAFRADDDVKQAAKGQPSLTNEDTGYQWKNDD